MLNAMSNNKATAIVNMSMLVITPFIPR